MPAPSLAMNSHSSGQSVGSDERMSHVFYDVREYSISLTPLSYTKANEVSGKILDEVVWKLLAALHLDFCV